jgi:hypothetical protein
MKYVISENQVDKIKSKIHEYVKKYGFEKCREIFGEKVLLTIGFNNDPMEFLNLFNDLDIVVDSEYPKLISFHNETGDILIDYDSKNQRVYFDYLKIWTTLRQRFNLTYKETQQLTEKWLGETYNITDVIIGDQ